MNLAVLSAGTWGISLAALLQGKGHDVRVWEFAPAVVNELTRTRRHPKLPGFRVPADLLLTTNIARALQGADAIVFVPPAAHLRETAKRVAEAGYRGQRAVVCSKGIEQGTHALPAEIVLAELGAAAAGKVGVLSGPSHAEEVSRGLPTAVTAASADLALAEWIRDLFMTPRFRVYTQTDVVGVELAAALKNVIAISCGVSDGLGFGDNAKAGLITRGLQEILRLGVARGAKAETFFGLAGIGDLVVTCMSRHSRNWTFGSLVGAGTPPEQALKDVGMVVEGYYTVRAAVELAKESRVEMPISREVANVLFHGKNPLEAVSALMLRDPKQE
jgi:glycerol-3-phosphate dehydrogenase (NAD(P)+)